METLNIIVQTTHNETISKEFRFSDGELKIMTSFPHITFGGISYRWQRRNDTDYRRLQIGAPNV